MNEEQIKSLLENVQYSLMHLTESANSNKDGYNMHSSIAEMNINDQDYQLQVSFVSDREIWIKEDAVVFSETTIK
jgi:hypothetical protein